MKLTIKRHQTIKPLSALLLILAPPDAPAADVAAPGAGSMLQQLQPVKPAAPSPSGNGIDP